MEQIFQQVIVQSGFAGALLVILWRMQQRQYDDHEKALERLTKQHTQAMEQQTRQYEAALGLLTDVIRDNAEAMTKVVVCIEHQGSGMDSLLQFTHQIGERMEQGAKQFTEHRVRLDRLEDRA